MHYDNDFIFLRNLLKAVILFIFYEFAKYSFHVDFSFGLSKPLDYNHEIKETMDLASFNICPSVCTVTLC